MSDLDLPLLPSAEQIRRRQFATVRRGYDPDQVQEYLNQIATQVEVLEGDLREERMQSSGRADAQVQAPAPAPTPAPVVQPPPAPALDVEDAYAQLSARLANVIRVADEQAQQLVADARTEAKKIMEEAQTEADRIRVDAQASAEDARAKSAAELERAREEADRVLGGLEQRREAMLAQMHEMQSRLLAVAQHLDVPEVEPTGGAHASTAAPPTPEVPAPGLDTPAERASAPAEDAEEAGQGDPTPAPVGGAAEAGGDMVDPRYEDLWASTETPSVDIPDLSSLDIDFDDEERD
jgi:cell division initiation protein